MHKLLTKLVFPILGLYGLSVLGLSTYYLFQMIANENFDIWSIKINGVFSIFTLPAIIFSAMVYAVGASFIGFILAIIVLGVIILGVTGFIKLVMPGTHSR